MNDNMTAFPKLNSSRKQNKLERKGDKNMNDNTKIEKEGRP